MESISSQPFTISDNPTSWTYTPELSKAVRKICYVDKEKANDYPDGVLPFVLTERVVDRDSEVIEPAGAKVQNFLKNPVFLWVHDLRSLPIGRIIPETLKITPQRVTADVKFDMDDPFARLVYHKYKNGFLNAGSIRFLPISYSDRPVLDGQRGRTYKEWELLEFSAVPVPANPNALVQRKEFEGDERALKWYEVLEKFYQNDNFDHTPEGWVEMTQKIFENDEDEWAQFCKALGI